MLLFSLQDFWWALLVGLLASAIVAAVVEIIKNKKKNYHISSRGLWTREYFSQTSDDVEIKVLYKSHEVNSSLLVVDMILENDGKLDIRFDTHFSSGIFIKNPKFKFIHSETKSSDVNASCEVTEDSIFVRWDILKVGESVHLEIVVEPNDGIDLERRGGKEFFSGLKYEFRSDCIDEIPMEEDRKPLIIRITRTYAFRIVSCFVILTLYLFMALSSTGQYTFEVGSENESVQFSTVLYSPIFDRYVILGKNSGISVLNPSEMPLTMTLQPVQRSSFDCVLGMVLEGMVYVMAFLLAGILVLWGTMRSRNKKRLELKE